MAPMIPAHTPQLDGDEPAILSCFVVEDEPDPDPRHELAW